MAVTIKLWSGREIRALRDAKRMSISQFAGHLGVGERLISKWEAGGEKLHPRPVNQEALDTCLANSPEEVHARFADLLGLGPAPSAVEASVAAPVAGATLLLGGHQVRHPIDGKLMTLVAEGVFLYGPEDQPVYLPGYYIDVYPTTNGDYARFVAATAHRRPQHWSREGGPPPHLIDHPVVFVTWRDAAAYAEWAAKVLPSSHQWEKAARGLRGDTYPWGSQLTPAKCNVRESGLRQTTPVDRYHSGVSPYGVYDMCGNTWEWLSTESEPGRHELKGSAFTSPFSRATPSTFNDAAVDMLDDDTGFRCVTPAETLRALLKMSG
ncbi:SUMF1/EgtB/PvdO family nonheme iron enzyme [Nonomuraea ceibae]|uniref:SUMF1/EgtB/PvdO family nonheme iron enzyme n=1 Tax=Nonomuraea ceibae TaxID=1935170 RepID=UPI001C5E450D|nr:SUMF1/EgtB/PvdO family nonheme iron enzyme [Nonomuraea ceibae]